MLRPPGHFVVPRARRYRTRPCVVPCAVLVGKYQSNMASGAARGAEEEVFETPDLAEDDRIESKELDGGLKTANKASESSTLHYGNSSYIRVQCHIALS